jgi:hypothetical protein
VDPERGELVAVGERAEEVDERLVCTGSGVEERNTCTGSAAALAVR